MKNLLMKIVMHFLYKGIKVLNGRDSIITNEINSLPNGYKVKLSTDIIKPKCKCFAVITKNNKRKVVKVKNEGVFDLEIKFKNKNLAFKVFMGQKSIAEAYSEHYFQMFGNIYIAMGVTRIMERVEGYLFPKFINKKLLKRSFKKQISMFRIYLLCLFC